MRRIFHDWRWWALLAAAGLLAAAVLRPYGWREAAAYPLVAVVDITRSMNVRDMRLSGVATDRIGYVRTALRRMLRRLPCGSRLGVGVFTGRRTTLLLMPLEVCGHFHELSRVIGRLDWRMAWEADSRVAAGLLDAMTLMMRPELREYALLWFTDGHEAPPVNPRYQPRFSTVRGKVKGLLVGVGGAVPAPIPKFGEDGRQQGFYRPEDVPHRSTFGEPVRPPRSAPGFHARNAPFGGEWVLGQEHLSSLREAYLRRLADTAGLGYHSLSGPDALLAAVDALGVAETVRRPRDWRPWLGGVAWLLLAGVYAGGWMSGGDNRRKNRKRRNK